jgi:DNA ligase-1
MLSGKFSNFEEECQRLPYPLLATPKLDGIRCIKVKGKALSRNFKPIPNNYIRETIEEDLPDNIDMELVVGDSFNNTTSGVMSEDGEPDFTAYIIDYVKDTLDKPYIHRISDLQSLRLPSYCIKIMPIIIHNVVELHLRLKEFLEQGYEGMMIREPNSIYKCGRGTLSKCDLIKVKPFVDAEAIIVGYEEMMENTNKAESDAFGNIKRSQSQAGMVGKGTLGKWIVKGINGKFKGVEFGLGTAKGVTQEMRADWWRNRNKLIGKVVTYKYQEHGSIDAPRIPVFKGFRDRRDM